MTTPVVTLTPADRMPDEMWRLYRESFPPDERRDEAMLAGLICSGTVSLLLISADDSGSPLGFATVWRLPLAGGGEVRYVEHLATLPVCRGRGIGGMAVSRLLHDGPLVLEVEPEGEEMADRRIGFYRRHGMTLHDGYDYWQPPYSPELNGLAMRLMTGGAEFDRPRLDEVRDALYRYVYRYASGD